jgi:lysophospholipase L1-like esterase
VALRVEVAPAFMAPEYDSGDGLHPSPLGLMRIAETVPVDALE